MVAIMAMVAMMVLSALDLALSSVVTTVEQAEQLRVQCYPRHAKLRRRLLVEHGVGATLAIVPAMVALKVAFLIEE